MSAKATGLIWEADLPRPEKYVLLALADHAKEDGSDVYPSLARVQWKTGYSETQVRDIIRSLIEQKILLAVKKGGSGPTDTNRYRIDFKALRMLQEFREWAANRKGAKTAPINNDVKGTETEPLKGAVLAAEGCGFAQNKGAKTEPEPRTIRTISTLEGDAASAPPETTLLQEQEKTETQPAETLQQNFPLPIDLPPIELEPLKPKAKAQDPRFPEICDAIRKSWPRGEGYKCDITPADAGAIGRMLATKHDWKAEELAVCIVARFMSASINPTESAKAWIGAVTDYQSGPRDKYGTPLYEGRALNEWRNQARVILYGPQPEQMAFTKPMEVRSERTHGQTGKAQQRQDTSIESIRTAVSRISGRIDGFHQGAVSEPRADARDSGSVSGGLGADGEPVRH